MKRYIEVKARMSEKISRARYHEMILSIKIDFNSFGQISDQ